jgi:hypothetical protein
MDVVNLHGTSVNLHGTSVNLAPLFEEPKPSISHQAQHFLAAPGIIEEAAEQAAGGHADAVGFDPPARHAAMLCLDHHRDAVGVEIVPDALGDLCGEPLLHLKPLGIAIEHAGELGDAHNPVLGHIGNGGRADDGGHMMFAVGLERDILEQDQLIISAHLFKGPGEMEARVLAIARTIFEPGPCHPLGRVEQAFAARIIARPFDQGPDRVANLSRDGRLIIVCAHKVSRNRRRTA